MRTGRRKSRVASREIVPCRGATLVALRADHYRNNVIQTLSVVIGLSICYPTETKGQEARGFAICIATAKTPWSAVRNEVRQGSFYTA